MPPEGSAAVLGSVVSHREARLLFWLVNMTPVAVFVVAILGTAVAGIMGAICAIPTAAAILSVTDYLRQRDVLLRADEPDDGPADGAEAGPGPVAPDAVATVEEA
jgi:hypothetical protein